MGQGTPKLYLQPRSFSKTPEIVNYLHFHFDGQWTVQIQHDLNCTPAISHPQIYSTCSLSLSLLMAMPSFQSIQTNIGAITFFFSFSYNPHPISQEALLGLPSKCIQIPTTSHYLHSTTTLVQATITSCFQ